MLTPPHSLCGKCNYGTDGNQLIQAGLIVGHSCPVDGLKTPSLDRTKGQIFKYFSYFASDIH